jgi:hypothetical protein
MYVEQVSRVIGLLQGKWTVQILCAMRERPKRLSELRRVFAMASKSLVKPGPVTVLSVTALPRPDKMDAARIPLPR